MAANSFEEEKSYVPDTMDGNRNKPLSSSCFQLVNPSFEENNHCALDVFPILFEEASVPLKEKCPSQVSHVQDVYGISLLPEEGNTSPDCASQLVPFLSFVGVPFPSKDKMCLDAQLDCQNCIDLQMESGDAYSSCIVDINIEKENSETHKPSNEVVGNLKNEGVVTHTQKVLQRQASSNIDKASPERIHEGQTNRWRRYRRAASFDSRKVVLLFSILSSLGTLVLIYLTLRVRQNGENFGHI